MARKKRQRAYLLPDTACPTARREICIKIPDELGHLLPFLGQLEYLTHWYAWEDDGSGKNVETAACWRDVFDAVRANIDNQVGCAEMDIRLQGCTLQKASTVG